MKMGNDMCEAQKIQGFSKKWQKNMKMHDVNDKNIAKVDRIQMLWGPPKRGGPVPMAPMAQWTTQH